MSECHKTAKLHKQVLQGHGIVTRGDRKKRPDAAHRAMLLG